jgi:hypothetical protein
VEITAIGWILFILGPTLLAVRPRWLYAIAVFSMPFTGTEVANVGSGLDASGVQVSMFLGSLLLFRHVLRAFWRMRFWFPRHGRGSVIWLGSFTAVTGLSLIMPLWINGHVQVPSAYLGDFSDTPLVLHTGNFTGFLYMVYGFAFAYLIAEMNRTMAALLITVKCFLAGSIFAALWGLMEYACKISGITYPAVIFNNGKGMSTLGYAVPFLTAGVPRLSSVAVEPSILAQTFLVALSLYLPFVFGKQTLFGKKRDRLFFILIFVVLLLSSSSTAYVGVLVLLLLVLFLFGIRSVLTPKRVAVTLTAVGTVFLLYASVPIVKTGLDAILFSKADGGSAVERFMTIRNAYEMFLQYPVLGVGWTSVTSHDLIFNILGNAGLLGLLTFSMAMYSIFRPLHRSITLRKKALGTSSLWQIDLAVSFALGITLATSITSGFPGVFSFFWFAIGLAISASTLMETENDSFQIRPCDSNCDLGAIKPATSPRPC